MTQDFQNSTQRICLNCGGRFAPDQQVCPHDGTRLADTSRDAFIGTTFAEKYQIESLLGRGGMSVVYRARHLLMDRTVAIKMLRAELVSDAQTMQRFQQESKALSSLNHPNIMMVFDFGVTEEGVPYLVMDYLHGETLASLITQYGRMPADKALNVFVQACDALAHAHLKNVVHRDIKPSNLVLTRREDGFLTLRIVDFGIAKMLQKEGTQSHQLTQTGEIFGSPLYMSPEQCVGKRLDWRSDIYSLGCVMYEALTGRPPLVGETSLETILMQTRETPPSFAVAAPTQRIPSGLEAIVFTAMNKNPELRHQSMDELAQELRRLASQLGISVVPAQAGTHGTIPPPIEVPAAVPEQSSQSIPMGPRHTRKGEFVRGKSKSGPGIGLVASVIVVVLALAGITATAFYVTGRAKLPIEGALNNTDSSLEVKDGARSLPGEASKEKKDVPGYAEPNMANLPSAGGDTFSSATADASPAALNKRDLLASGAIEGTTSGAVAPPSDVPSTSPLRTRSLRPTGATEIAAVPAPALPSKSAPASQPSSVPPLPLKPSAIPTQKTWEAKPSMVAEASAPNTVLKKLPAIGDSERVTKPVAPPVPSAVVALNDTSMGKAAKGDRKPDIAEPNIDPKIAKAPANADPKIAKANVDPKIAKASANVDPKIAKLNANVAPKIAKASANVDPKSARQATTSETKIAKVGTNVTDAKQKIAGHANDNLIAMQSAEGGTQAYGDVRRQSNYTALTPPTGGTNVYTRTTATTNAPKKASLNAALPTNNAQKKTELNTKVPTAVANNAKKPELTAKVPATTTNIASKKAYPNTGTASNKIATANIPASEKSTTSSKLNSNLMPLATATKAPPGTQIFKTARVFCYYPKGWKASGGGLMTLTCPGASIVLTRQSGTLAAYLLSLQSYFSQIGARRGDERTENIGKFRVVSQIATVPNRARNGALTMYRMDWYYNGQVYSLIGQAPVSKAQALVYCVRKIAESLDVR